MSSDLIAAAYDILSDPKTRLEIEGAFLKGLAGKGRVLDLACATGVHAEFLARWGATVTACDLEPAMIRVAEAKRRHERVHYEVRDMRTPPRGPFDLILCMGNSLSMLGTIPDVTATLQAACASLGPGGRVLVHILNPAAPARQKPTLTTKTGEIAGRELLVAKAMVPHGDRRFVSVTYFLRQEKGEVESNPDWETMSRATALLDLTQAQLADLLTAAGFHEHTWYGGLDGQVLVPDGSPDLVVVASS